MDNWQTVNLTIQTEKITNGYKYKF